MMIKGRKLAHLLLGVASCLFSALVWGNEQQRPDPCIDFINQRLQEENLGTFHAPTGKKIPTEENPRIYQSESEKLDLAYIKDELDPTSDNRADKKNQVYLQKDADLAKRFNIDDTKRFLLSNNYDYDRSIAFSDHRGKKSLVVYQNNGKIIACKIPAKSGGILILLDYQCVPEKLVMFQDPQGAPMPISRRETLTAGICENLGQLQNLANNFPSNKVLLAKVISSHDGEIIIDDQLPRRMKEEIPQLCQKFPMLEKRPLPPTLPLDENGGSFSQ